MLVSILILIIFAEIKTAPKWNFFALGMMPCFSLSSFFVMFGCFCDLFITAFKEKDWKNFFIRISIFLIPFASFILFFLIPVSRAHYGNMEGYWAETFALVSNIFDYVKAVMHFLFRTEHAMPLMILYCASSLLMFVKNYRLALYSVMPVIVTFLLTITHHYPLSERFLLFLLPLILIVFLYPLSLISVKKQTITAACLLITLIYGIIHIPPVEMFHIKQEYGKEAWKYLAETYDGKTPVVLGEDFVTNLYYRIFYGEDFNFYDTAYAGKKNADEALILLPQGEWYFIISRYSMRYYGDFAKYLNSDVKVLDMKLYEPVDGQKSKVVMDMVPSAVIKIRK